MPSQVDNAAWRRSLVGFGHLLRLVVWIVPYCVVIFAALGFASAGRWLWRASDWIYDRAGIDAATRWKDGIRAR